MITDNAFPECHPPAGEVRQRRSGFLLRPALRLLSGLVLAAGATFAAASSASAANVVTIQQVSSGRFADAHESQEYDYTLVTRPAQNNNTQYWRMVPLGNNIFTFQQMSNNRFMDAHENQQNDYRLVTRPAQNDNTQRWFLTHLGNNVYTFQQVSSGRFMDAHEDSGNDYRMVTRPAQNDNTQRWRITVVYVEPNIPLQPLQPLQPIFPPLQPLPPAPVVHVTGTVQTLPSGQIDFDSANGFGGTNDLNYQVIGFIRHFTPVNGAQISFTNGAQRGFAGCSAASYSTTPVPQASVPAGGYVCLRTAQGRITEFRVDSIGVVLGLLTATFTTWQP